MEAVNLSVKYSERDQRYRHFTQEEWDIKTGYTYDDYFGFSDLRIYKMQNNHRYYYMRDKLGVPPDSASFCTAFNTDRERHRLIQRHLCDRLCFWDPQECFLEDSHSGNLGDIMHQEFHDKFQTFTEQFDRKFSDKIDWAPTGGLGHFPSIGVNKLIDELGITSKLRYDSNGYAINFENLSKELRNSIPDRPLYVMEEKKCHDIIEAMININSKKIENSWREMEKKYDQSYMGNGPMRKPILSLMMWGPLTDYELKKTNDKCKYDTLEDRQAGVHMCTNISEKHFWMYTHSDKVECIKGPLTNLEGPATTLDLRVIYPCNRSGCNHDCLCDLCSNSHLCNKTDHKIHLQETGSECIVEKNVQCQEHNIDHPHNFDDKEDVSVQKNMFYHNLKLKNQPRKHSAGQIKFSGVKKKCKICLDNVKNHFKHHNVVHLNCKFCEFQMKTAIDKQFWERVCSICGKIFSNIKNLQYWHKRTHNSDWICHECDINFNRRWTLKRHFIEIHNMKPNEFEFDSEEDNDTEFELCSDTDNDSIDNI